jgi:putative spermidine/putrescine transport system substrate-binding protein
MSFKHLQGTKLYLEAYMQFGNLREPEERKQNRQTVSPRRHDMNRFTRIGALCVFTAASAAASAQTTLYVGSFGGSTEQLFREKIIPPFEAKHNAKVVYVPGNSTDTLAKLAAQKAKQDLSVALIDDGPMYQAVEQKLCAPIADAPVLKDIYSNARMIGNRSIGVGFIATGLAYNKDVFKKNGWAAPTSWADLSDPKYKGKVVIPPITNGYGLLTLVMTARMNGGGEEKIDPGFDTVQKKIAPNVLAWEGSPGRMAQMLQTGEAGLVVWGNGRVQAVIDQGAPVEFVYPKEGAIALMTAICPVEGAPQPALAQAFLQYVLSPEVQALLADKQGWGPVNKTTKIAPEVASRVVFGPEKVDKLVSVNYNVINAKRADWTTRWNRTIER